MECKFKQNLKEELAYQNITVKQLAKETGIPIRTIENYLSKRNSLPPIDNAYLIAKVLGVSIEWLVIGGIPEKERNNINADLLPLLKDLASLPKNIQNIFKTLTRYMLNIDKNTEKIT